MFEATVVYIDFLVKYTGWKQHSGYILKHVIIKIMNTMNHSQAAEHAMYLIFRILLNLNLTLFSVTMFIVQQSLWIWNPL